MANIHPELLDYCTTAKQMAFIKALISMDGKVSAAAEQMGMNVQNAYRMLKAIRARAAGKGFSPEHDMTHTVPDGFKIKGTSTLYDEAGKPKIQWVKTTADTERQHEIMQAALEAVQSEIPRLPPLPCPERTMEALCNVYTLSDAHVGMLAWRRENLDRDWDLSIAEKQLVGGFEAMIAQSPKASTAVVNQLGDFLHFDGLAAVTPTSGHLLDADGRYGKVVEASVRILRRIVDLALQSHERVHVVMAEGNHDLASSVWLRKLFCALYENEPRVTVDDSELPYYVFRHGKVMLAFHHGHLKKNDALPLLFASQFPDVWGITRYRHAHTGHRHHLEVKEHSGMTVTQHATLASRDAHASRGGWQSHSAIRAFTYHAEYGEVGSVTVTPEMLEV